MADLLMSVTDKLTPKAALPDSNGWKGRHMRASRVQPVALMITALDQYQRVHRERYASDLAADYVLGPAFVKALAGVRAMLDGETHGLDCGTCDGAILAIYSAAGFEGEL
jgi:hypothetical protein